MGRYATEALVIRVVPFAETSQVVHLATPEQGLVAALAKGARRPGAAFQGGLTLGSLGLAELSTRRGAELELLRRFRREARFRALSQELDRYYAASYVLDLLRAWMRPALPNTPLYRAATTTLAGLNGAEKDSLPGWIVFFEARAVAACGYRPRLDACAVCGRAAGAGDVFSPAAGGIAHGTCVPPGPRRNLSKGALEGLIRLYTARLPDLAAEPLPKASVRDLRATHDLLIPHLLERRPASLASIPRA